MYPPPESLTEFLDKKRNLLFKPTSRIHWFEYSQDMIIRDGGFGIIIDIKLMRSIERLEMHESHDAVIVAVLCDNGQLRDFPIIDLDLEDPWE